MSPIQIRIENFRSYHDSGEVDLCNKTILVGENNSGKSNFVDAVCEFFRFSSRARQDLDNFYNRDKSRQIKITIWFDNLTDAEKMAFEDGVDEPETGELAVRLFSEYNVDEERAETNDYQLLINGETSEWAKKTGLANDLDEVLPDVSHYGAQRELDDAAKTSNKSSLLYKLLGSAYDDIPQASRDSLEDARETIKNELENDTPQPIDELSESLNKKMTNQVSMEGELNFEFDIPDLREIVQRYATVWTDDSQDNTIEDMGSGSQMSFVLSCIWEVTDQETEDIFLALEEPENYLHPHSIRQLRTTIDDLAGDGDFAILTTHSPELANLREVDTIRRVHHSDGSSKVEQADDYIERKDIETLQTIGERASNEMLFSRTVVACEGPSDRDVLRIANTLLTEGDNEIRSFDAQGISVVEAGSKHSVHTFVRMARDFGIPVVAVRDTDYNYDKDDDGDSYRGHVHWDKIRECRKADEFVMLEEDLEYALFEELSLQQFHESMERVSSIGLTNKEYTASLSGLRKKIENQDEIEEPQDVMKVYFEACEPSKPAFGRVLAEKCEIDSFPDNLQDVVEQAGELAE